MKAATTRIAHGLVGLLLVTACSGVGGTVAPSSAVGSDGSASDCPSAANVPSGVPTLKPGDRLTINMVGQTTTTQIEYTEVEKPYTAETIPARSHCRVSITLTTWQELGADPSTALTLLRQGQQDIAGANPGDFGGQVPLMDGIALPALTTSEAQTNQVFDAFASEVNKDLEPLGVKMIAGFPFPAQYMFCRTAIQSLSDLSGRRVRVSTKGLSDLMLALGAVPVNIPFADTYASLERGVIDCAVTGAPAANSQRWYEVTSYVYLLPLGYSPSAYFVALKWWNSLAPDVRDFLDASIKDLAAKQRDIAVSIGQDGLDCNAGRAATCKRAKLVTGKVMVENKPSASDLQAVKTLLQTKLLPEWVKRCGGSRCVDAFNRTVAPIVGFQAQ